MSELECVRVEPSGVATSTVIWLHGLGADGHDFEAVVPALRLPKARFVFPHAPVRKVTINMGMEMRAWYDIISLERDQEDLEGVRDSATLIEALIEAEVKKGIDPSQIILAGFSQGGVMALHVGLRHVSRLAGVLALSCYLPVAATLDGEKTAANADVPIFMAHGSYDPVVPIHLGQDSRDYLKERDYKVQWQTYPIQHQVSPREIDDIARWMGLRLS